MNPQDQERGKWTSASNAQADKLCPGRHLATRDLPEESTSDSEFGDMVHAELSGKTLPRPLTSEEESVAESCRTIRQKVVDSYFSPGVQGMGVKEHRYWVRWPDGLQHSGQVDEFLRQGTKGLVIEYKSLPGDVPSSPKNMQLRDQVCLVDANVPLLKEIATVVIQPLVTHSPELCVYTKQDILRAREEMYYRVAASNKPDSPRIAGEVQCKFCKAKPACKEYTRWASSLVPVPPSIVDIPVAQWTPEQRQQFCDNFSVAQKWLDTCWAEMEKGAKLDPDYVPGYELAKNPQRSSIINLQSVFDRLSEVGGSLEDFMAKATISKKDLTELARKATKTKGKKLDEAVETIIGSDFVLSKETVSLKKVKA